MRKNRKRAGFTLTEVLVATAILAIFVSMAIVGTTALFGTGEQMMAVSKAAILGSDVMKAITNEIRFGEEFTLKEEGGEKTLTYHSTSFGADCVMTLDEKGQLIVKQDAKTFYPVGSAAYDEVHISAISFTVKNETKDKKSRQTVSCTLSITDGVNTLWENTISAIPLADKSTTNG